jgi:exoribonuclease R
MPARWIRVDPAAALRDGFEAIRREAGVPERFGAEAHAESEAAAAAGPGSAGDRVDLPFVTIDPPGSRDLDQALHIARRGDGHRVSYAIADVGAFVTPGGALDRESHGRAVTVYAPDRNAPLHPPVLSEGAASLLPGEWRPAVLWTFDLDARGEPTATDVVRAQVRSTAQHTYEDVPAELAALLAEVGERRMALERERGGVRLNVPEQEVVRQDGSWTVHYRVPLAAEDHNAQVSLLTGMAAATMMLEAGVGVLRTMPAPTPEAVAWFRRVARGLGAEWPEGVPYGEFVRGLDRANPRHLALIHEATALFRGAGYTAFEGEPPAQPEHAAVAAPYAHVTAPLRRLVDRFGLVVCEAACRGADVPDAVRAALPELAGLMRDSDGRARAAERACADATEAAVLHGREGESFGAIVVDHTDKGMEVQLVDLPVIARVTGGRAGLGTHLSVRLDLADVRAGEVAFSHE